MLGKKFILLLCLFASTLLAQPGLGESLLQEGRMAMARSEQYLSSTQGRDGSWDGCLVTTAQVVMALANAGLTDSSRLQAAGDFLRSHGRIANAEGLILSCRSLLRLEQQLSAACRVDLARQATAGLSFQASHWLLEIHYLLDRQSTPLLQPAEVSTLLLRLQQNPQAPAALRLFAALCPGDSDLHAPGLSAWRQAALAAPGECGSATMLWFCRAMRAYDALFPGGDGAWRASVTVRLLEAQNHDGSWGDGSSQALHTALALQALQHCLAAD